MSRTSTIWFIPLLRLPISQRSRNLLEAENLRISEIFFSLQGETSRSGLPTVFVRLTGCPLRCAYCDTDYAFYGGKRLSISDILAEVASYCASLCDGDRRRAPGTERMPALLTLLCDAGYSVSLETSGALDISKVDDRVSRILDIKTPGSGEAAKNRWSNLHHLTSHDEVKFVLCDEADYQWALEVMHERQLNLICPILFSPVYGKLDPATLAAWVLRDRIMVRVQIQLHKLLWGEGAGR